MKPRRPWYLFCQFVLQATFVGYFRIRIFWKENVPLHGGLLFVSNHQSYLDPIFCTVGIAREFHYLARDSLFLNPFFAKLIRSLNAFPVGKDRQFESSHQVGSRVLLDGKAVVIFAEGTRTRNGKLQKFHHGAAKFAHRTKVPVVPVYIQGAYHAYPKGVFFPLPRPVHIFYGKPIAVEEYESLDIAQLTQLLFERVSELEIQAQQQLFQ